jgi:hypothetical protein
MKGMRIGFGYSVLAFVGCLSAVTASGQTVERDTTITGPRGRTMQRQVETQRGPGTISRQIQIKRPGGTFDRQVQIQRTPGVLPGRGGPLIGGPWPRPAWLPRPVIVGAPAPAFGFGLMAAPMLNFSFGGGVGGPGVAGPGGMGPGPGGMGPGPGGMGPGGPPQPPDHVALETQRLQSFLSGTRKNAAYALGRLGDPRAVPSLVHVLKYDAFKDVRIASAIALGEIGGSESAIALERASIYDKREDVRKAAATALERLNAKAGQPMSSQVVPQGPVPPPPGPSTNSPFSGYPAPGATAPDTPAPSNGPAPAQSEPALQPPPPPTPVTAGPQGAGS